MKYNYPYLAKNEPGSVTEWAVLTLVTDAYEFIPNGFPPNFDATDIDITLTVNGIEVDLMRLLQERINVTETEIREKALEIVNDKFNDLVSSIYTAQEIFNNMEGYHE